MVEEKEEYKPLLTERIKLMEDGLKSSPHFLLESYPN